MIKFKDPLNAHPGLVYEKKLVGATGINAADIASFIAKSVKATMHDDCGIEVSFSSEEICIGGMFSKSTQPGIKFEFTGTKYCNFLLGVNRIAGLMDICLIHYGTVSPAMQRLNIAESKGKFSLSGAITKATVNTAAVDEERMYYDSLVSSVENVVESYVTEPR